MENDDSFPLLSPRLKLAIDRSVIIGAEREKINKEIAPQLQRLDEIQKEMWEIEKIVKEEITDDYSHR